MPTDVLTLGGITFDDFSTPERMMGGGNQAMVVHKLPAVAASSTRWGQTTPTSSGKVSS